jgi:catechol 2,3-dioxygenase-like lactoylglutathione lyase family enzyme
MLVGMQLHRPTVLGLDHVTLRIADLDDAAAFYGGVLGAGVERWPDRLVVRFGVGPDLHLYLAPRGEPPDPVSHIGLRVDPDAIAVFLGRISAHGVAVEGPTRVGLSGAALHFLDPFGNHLELITEGYRGPVVSPARTSPSPRGASARSSTRTSPR